ncbi:MAG: glycosyltransferase family 39 protein, partial [Pirellulales bacterium]
LGRAIAAGEPYRHGPNGPAIFRTPGYPLLLAPLFVVFGQDARLLWGRVENVLLGTAAVAAVWWVGRMLFGDRAGLLAAGIAAVYPGAVGLSAMVLTETPFALMMMLQLGAAVSAWQDGSAGRAGMWGWVCGALGGLATLVRPSWLLFTPVIVALLLVVAVVRWRGNRRRKHAGQAPRINGVTPGPGETPVAPVLVGAGMIVGLIAVMAPWWVRNYAVVGRFVPTTLQVGASLYDGLNPDATGASDMRFVERFRKAEQGRAGEAPLEVRLDRRLRHAAIDWAAAHPGEALRLAGVKFARTWNVWPNEPAFRPWPIRLAVAGTYLPVLVLGLCGAAATLRRGWAYWLCWLPAVYIALLHVVFVGSIRYRQPAMFGLMILASGAATRCFHSRGPHPGPLPEGEGTDKANKEDRPSWPG